MSSVTQELADFAVDISYEELPLEVVHESKRLLLDSLGCAIGGLSTEKGKVSVSLARRIGGNPESTIIGTGDKVSSAPAAFANGELINALDYDALFSPDHVSPFVLAAPLAIAELKGSSGKDLIVAKDTPGFVVNALLVPYLFDAMRMLESGIATREDIDTGIKLGLNHPMGPLTLSDFVGLDTLHFIGQAMYEDFKDPKYASPLILKKMVTAGWYGRKSGKGFYDYQ